MQYQCYQSVSLMLIDYQIANSTLQAFWVREEFSQHIMETIFGVAGIAIILVVCVYVEVWCNF